MSPAQLMLRPKTALYLPNGKARELKTLYTDGAYEDPQPASPTSAMTTNVKDEVCDVTWCVWQVLAHKSRTKSPRNMEIGRKVAYRTRNNAPRFQVQRSEVKSLDRLMFRQKMRHIFREKLETWYTVEAWTATSRAAPWPPKSKVTVTRSCGTGSSERSLYLVHKPIMKIPETAKLVGRLPIPRTIMLTSFKVKRSKVKQGYQADYCWDRKCIISTEREGLRTSKLVRRWSMRYQLPPPAMNACEGMCG